MPTPSKDAIERLKQKVKRSGLKLTRQRETICEVFFAQTGHSRAEEILNQARLVDANVSLATVYRTLKILQEHNFAVAHNFQEGQALFEPNFGVQAHHDHLICTECHKVVEFCDPRVHNIQTMVGELLNFKIFHHSLNLYGICGDCQAKLNAKADDI